MPLRIIADDTGDIASWGFSTAKCTPMLYNAAFGVFDGDELKGCILFTGYNGSEAEIHFQGVGALNRYTFRTIHRIALQHFNLNRLYVRTRKLSMARGVVKLGAVYEGKQRRVYGPTDDDCHAAECFVFFRETMAKIAKIEA